jgi:hypothetical protein
MNIFEEIESDIYSKVFDDKLIKTFKSFINNLNINTFFGLGTSQLFLNSIFTSVPELAMDRDNQIKIISTYVSNNFPKGIFNITFIEKKGKIIKNVFKKSFKYNTNNVKDVTNLKNDIKRFIYVMFNKYDGFTDFGLDVIELSSIDSDFNLKDGEFNCLLDLIRNDISKNNRIKSKDNYYKKINDLNKKYFKSGVNKDAVDEIAKKLKVNILVKDIDGNDWHKTKEIKNKKIYTVLSHNGHASDFEIINFNYDYIIDCDDIEETYKNNEENPKMLIRNNDGKIVAFRTKRATYRPKIMPDWENEMLYMEDNLDEYKYCLTKSSKIKKDMGINKLFRNTFDIIKEADYHRHSVNFKKSNESVIGYDQNNAYPSFELNKYYNKFNLPNSPTQCYKVSETDYKYLELSGFCVINNVDMTKAHKYFTETKYLQNNCIYPNNLLYFLKYDCNINFDIIAILYHPKPYIKKFPFKDDDKFYNNALIGSLITKDTPNIIEICSNNKADLVHLSYIASKSDKISVDTIDEYSIKLSKPCSKSYSQKYHVHSYILGYQQISFLEQLLKFDFDELVSVKVDAFYVNTDKKIDISISDKRGDWKIENKKPFQNPFKDELDWTQNEVNISELNELDKRILKFNKNISIEAPAGCGKSYLYTEDIKLNDLVILCATRELRDKYKKMGLNAFTYHKYCNIETKTKTNYRNANVLFDDVSLVHKYHFDIVMKKLLDNGSFIIITFDRYQLKPVEGEVFMNSKYFDDFYFDKQNLTKLRRFNGEMETRMYKFREMLELIPDIEKTDNILEREKEYYPYVKLLLELFSDRFIKKENVPENAFIVCPTNLQKNDFKLAHTIHITQGKTINSDIYVDCRNIMKLSFDVNLLYVAISRCVNLKNVNLIV